MTPTVLGIHHVTAIAGDPQRNVDFYAGVLGLRLVKRTVNFDDPTTYHFYFGDEQGTPGSILTFFPWPGARGGRPGNGQVNFTAFAVPSASLGYWLERLVQLGVPHEGPVKRFDEQVVTLADRDGLRLEIVASPSATRRPGWSDGDVPAEHAIRGIHTVSLWVDALEPTADMLIETLGFRHVATESGTHRFESGDGGSGTYVDVRPTTGFWRGAMGVGVVHHVAFRAEDDDAEHALARRVMESGTSVTKQMDRQYFRSVYFREPGGVLFELATDAPGFAIDEAPEALGMELRLPPWLESHRATIEAALPPIHLPSRVVPAEAAQP